MIGVKDLVKSLEVLEFSIKCNSRLCIWTVGSLFRINKRFFVIYSSSCSLSLIECRVYTYNQAHFGGSIAIFLAEF